MLQKYWRIIVVNNSGQTVTYDSNGRIYLHLKGINLTPATGKLVYGAIAEDGVEIIESGNSIADGANDKTGEIDNSSNLYPNALVQLEVKHDEGAAADGTFDVYYDGADTTGELASDQDGYSDPETNGLQVVGSLIWDSSPGDDETLVSHTFLI